MSPGCEHCYAERVAHRFSGPGKPYAGLTVLGKKGPRWSGEARFIPSALAEPLSWPKPQRIFVNSMSDLFHEDVTNDQIAAVFGVMAACPHLTFQILTKRPERMLEWFEWVDGCAAQLPGLIGESVPDGCAPQTSVCVMKASPTLLPHVAEPGATKRAERYVQACERTAWPLPNVWLGVSAEDQQRADERIPLLLLCPAVVRFVSAEPLLGPIDFAKVPLDATDYSLMRALFNPLIGGGQKSDTPWRIDWVIAGGESGPGARDLDAAWIDSIVQQCAEAGVACFVKQMGRKTLIEGGSITYSKKASANIALWPSTLRVRQFPAVRR